MKPPKYCFRCGREVQVNCHYFKFVEYDKNRKIKTDYAHKFCWDEIKSTLKVTNEAFGMLRGMRKRMVEDGTLPPEEEKFMEIV